jgi:expansin
VTAMVNDQCPECTNNHLDLDSSYAGQVDKDYQTKGIFDISWEFVPCPVSGKIQFKNKEGTSAYYFALQVRNSVLPIDKLEVSTNGGTSWTKVDRSEYNFFTAYGYVLSVV